MHVVTSKWQLAKKVKTVAWLIFEIISLGKYQVAFSTDAPNGNFNKINSQERKKHQRDKNRQNARKKRGEQKNYPGEQKIYLGSPEFELLKKEYIDSHFSQYIATQCQYQTRCFSESFQTEYRNSDLDRSRFADEIKDILSTCITTLYERLLFQARGEYVPVDDFSWFEQITEAEMQHIVNQLFESDMEICQSTGVFMQQFNV